MWKKMLLLPMALFMLWAVNIRVCWEVTVNNHAVPGFYSAKQLNKCIETAERAAEEILPGKHVSPRIGKSCRLRLKAADGDEQLLTHSLILSTEGIVSADGVFANGIALGTVEDGQELFSRLRAYIKNQMPSAAVMGSISGELSICPVYSSEGHETAYDDMLLLVSGIAPVFYVDSQGRLA